MARNIGVNFGGKRIVKPGAHSRIDASGLSAFGSGSEKKIVFFGSARGGEPGVYHEFSNLTEARNVLRGGDLLTAGELAWTPSGDGVGSSKIGFVRVEDAKQATLAAGGLTFKSLMYGAEANRIQVKLEDGSIEGSKRIIAWFWQDNLRETFDNLGPVFNIKYDGEAADATVTIAVGADGKATTLTLKVGADVIKVFSLGNGGEFKEVNKLIKHINDLPDFTASVTAAGGKNLTTDSLDAVADVSVKTDVFTATAFKGDILYNLATSELVEVEVTAKTPAEVTNFNYTYLTEGADGTVPASWADKLDVAIGEGAYIIVPLTSDEAIHAEVARFVEYQSGNENNEMRAFYGGGLGETIDRVINRAVTLNSTRATVCYPAITRKSIDDTVVKLPAYFTAAIIAGRVSGIAIGEPATFDYLNLIGVEKILSSGEINRLIENGVTVVEYVRSRNRNGFRIAQCITTYQDDANPAYRENSISEIMDFLNAELREHLEAKFVGTKGTAVTPALIKNEVQSFLDQKVREEWLVEYDPSSVVVSDGEVIRVSYRCMPVHSINYILITGAFYRALLTA